MNYKVGLGRLALGGSRLERPPRTNGLRLLFLEPLFLGGDLLPDDRDEGGASVLARGCISGATRRRKPVSEATKQKTRHSMTGRKVSLETCLKLRGGGNPNSILTEQQVREIHYRYKKGGISQEALAAQYGVKQTTISTVTTKRNWISNPPLSL